MRIAFLLTVVSISYRQEIYAYPSGGGDYAVAKANLPGIFALIVAGALLVDYVMTVAVSTSSAVEQVISAVPGLHDLRVPIAAAAILLIMLGNLRGLRESGNIFAIPTYVFVVLDAADDRHRDRSVSSSWAKVSRRRTRCPGRTIRSRPSGSSWSFALSRRDRSP